MVVALATIVAMATAAGTDLLIHFTALRIFGFDSRAYPLTVILVESAVAAIITSLPIVAYCIGLVRRLRETKYDLKRAAAAAEAANSAKSAFLANMSHEIRTPLNGVLGMADVLSREDLPPHQADLVRTIRESGTTLMAILNDVLDLSKIEAGKLEISCVDAALHPVFWSLHKLFLPRAQEKNIAFTLLIDETVPKRVRIDAVRVRQCVSNLVSNAIKFTAAGGVAITVSSTEAIDGRHLIAVDVADTGIGMSQEVMDRLFSDFAQADASTSRLFGGTGLGLAITCQLARLMDGDVTVTSTQSQGSAFTFTFSAAPARQALASPLDDLLPPDALGGDTIMEGARVLLVDDNAVNRKVIRLLLKLAKMEFVEASDGKEALDLLASQPFDLVLLDIHMPFMDGATTIRHLRASKNSWHGLPVIALTADAMTGDRERLLAMGMTGYISKPVDQRALVSEITRVLSAAKAQ